MNRYFTKFPITIIIVALLTNCNAEKEKSNETTAPAQTSSQTTISNEPDTMKEVADYTKRNINLTQQEWMAVKNKYLIADDGTNNKVGGNFKADGNMQILHLVAPKEDTAKDNFQECIGGCNSYVVSSDTSMPILKVSSNLGGQMKNIGDIDGDGADEIMVYPDWWQSNWNAYMVYSYDHHNNRWSFLIEPVSIFANELEKNIRFVKPSKQKGFASAYSSVSTDNGIKSSYKDLVIIK